MQTLSHNAIARLDRLPVWPFKYSLIVLLGFGYFFAFFDVTNIAFGLPVISQQFHVSTAKVAVSVSTSLFGYIAGAILLSIISDRFGRRKSIFFGVLLYTIGSVATAFSPNVDWLIVWRFVVGMGIGTMIAQVTTYLGELSPSRLRGRMTGFGNIFSFTGLAVVPFVSILLVPHFTWGWRALLLVGALGGVALIFANRTLIESPRWLAIQGRFQEVEEIVANAEATAKRRMKGEPLPPIEDPSEEMVVRGFPLLALFRRPYVSRVVILFFIWFTFYTADYEFLTLAPTFLVDKGYSLANSIYFLSITGLGFIGAAFAVYLLGDRFERKLSNLFWSVIALFSLAWVGLFPSPSVIMVGGFLATLALNTFAITNYALTAEHFPTGSRSSGVALADGVGHLGGAIAPFVGLWALHVGGFSFGFVNMALWMIGPIVLLPFTIRATRKTLTSVTSVGLPVEAAE